MVGKGKPGRPKAEIDFNEVRRLYACGGAGAAIARVVGVARSTLETRMEEEFGPDWREEMKLEHEGEKVLVKRALFDLALKAHHYKAIELIMKNLHGWRDNIKIDATTRDKTPRIVFHIPHNGRDKLPEEKNGILIEHEPLNGNEKALTKTQSDNQGG